MKRLIIPIVCLMLLAAGGCTGKKQEGPGDQSTGPGVREIPFERYETRRAPAKVAAAAKKNLTRESAILLEEEGSFWVVLTRGQMPTGGYSVRVADAKLTEKENGVTELTVSYSYNDPGPGQLVTQALTYPVEVVLLKGLSQMPGKVEYVQIPQK
ncbi:MAG: hypothetical protein CVU89_17085 [Firmicutes bacterium HGW-Firmicutes-14]|nr:MAG: hypothetical protein CVU89_17085 [Firmicutes bacterium HGW-Firmicutes-14]